MIQELLDYCEHTFKLEKPDQNGVTEREHLEQVQRQVGKELEELKGPEFPFSMTHIWSAFLQLNSARTAGFSGPNPITYEQIKAWKELTENPIRPREVEVLKRVDSVWMKVMNG